MQWRPLVLLLTAADKQALQSLNPSSRAFWKRRKQGHGHIHAEAAFSLAATAGREAADLYTSCVWVALRLTTCQQ